MGYSATGVTGSAMTIGQSRGGGASRVLCYDILTRCCGELESVNSGESEEGNPATAGAGIFGGGPR